MTVAGALLALAMTSCNSSSASHSTPDLEVYASVLLTGMHSHPTDSAGDEIGRAERAIQRRRERIRAWLVGRHGEASVSEVEEHAVEEAHGIYWIRGPSVDEEWYRIHSSQRAASELEWRIRCASARG